MGMFLPGSFSWRLHRWSFLALWVISFDVASAEPKVLPLPGTNFVVAGRSAFLIAPPAEKAKAQEIPWVWYAPTLPPYPGSEERWMFQKFLDAGIAIAGIDVGESYGSPEGRELYSTFYREMTEVRNLAGIPVLLARSRGGLMLYNWAVENPRAVGAVAGIYPVCDLRSYPGLEKAGAAYRMTSEELQKELDQDNPIARLAPLARAGVPIFHIHGTADTVVPLEQNSAELARRYRELGGVVELQTPRDQGHNMWVGFFQSQDLVDFVILHATGGADNYSNSSPKAHSQITP